MSHFYLEYNDAAAGNFTFTGDATGTISDDGQIIVNNLVAGAYTSTEADPSPAFALTGIVCNDNNSSGDIGTRTATFNVEAGETVKCIFTNVLQQGTLKVIKHVINDNGGSATASNFNLHVKNGDSDVTGSPQAGSEEGVDYSLAAGSYNVSEDTLPSGYSITGYSGDCDGSGNVEIIAGQTKTCTITNNDIAPSLTLIKQVINNNGGTAVQTNWTLSATGPTSISGAGGVISGLDFDAGTYALSESTGPAGYSASNWNCVGGTQTESNITLGLGESATCTITNDDIAPTLTLIKIVNNDNSGIAVPTDWTLYATGPTSISGAGGATSGESFSAGTYTLSESAGPPNYTADAWICEINGGMQVIGNSITLNLGDNVTCSIVNDDVQPKLTLIKKLIKDNGGTAAETDWVLSASGSEVSFSGVTGSRAVTDVGVDRGTYELSESGGPAGYSESEWSCIINDGQPIMGNSVTLDLGDIAICTITNDDIPAHLIVIKHVINDNGGTAQASDFTMTINDVTALDGNSFAGVESPGTDKRLTSVGSYSVTESSLAGYSDNYSADCSGTIALGETKTCTITNDDIAPSLTLVKNLITDNGGTASETDWILYATGPTSISGAGGVISGLDFDAGTYALSESTGPAGYDASNWNCVGGTQTESNITLELGESATCTITNDDIQPKLTLIKHVVNDNGGNAVVSDFPLFVGSTSVVSSVQNGFDAKSYVVSETTQAGYAPSAWSGDCSAEGNITLSVGDVKVCEITNDDIAPTITLNKQVNNNYGGNAQPSDFTLKIDNQGVTHGVAIPVSANTDHSIDEDLISGYQFVSLTGEGCPTTLGGTVNLDEGENITCTVTNEDLPAKITLTKVVSNNHGGNALPDDFALTIDASGVLSGLTTEVDSNTTHTLNETLLSGYDFVSITGDAKCPQVLGETVTLDEGEEISCTITNEDKPAKITLIKEVINDNGGTAGLNDFGISINGQTVTSGSTTEVNSNTTHTLNEAGLFGYQFVSLTGEGCPTELGGTVTLNEGQEITCTITNDDIQPTLTLVKTVINDNGGTLQVADFPLFIDKTQVTSEVALGVNAGTYTASETTQYGYLPSVWTGNCAENGSVTLSVGENKTCYITNDDIQPKLTLIKHVVNDDGGNAVVSDFPLFVGSTSVVSSVQNGFDAKSYVVSETTQAGYAPSAWSGDCSAEGNITLSVGDVKVCEITNDDIAPKLTLVKTVVNNNGGSAVIADFPLFIDGSLVTSGQANILVANTQYTATETGRNDYTASVWGGDCQSDGTIILQPGDDKTCTITNDDIPATLTIIKDADPNDCRDFSFSGDLGSFLLDDDQGVTECLIDPVNRNQSKIANNLSVGSYTVAEAMPLYWELESIACIDKDTGLPFPVTVDSTSMTVSLNLAQNVECTFINDKIVPTRTQGFWKTHTDFTSGIFSTYLGSNLIIGDGITHQDPIDSAAKLFGTWYSDVNFKTIKIGKKQVKRENVDKTRMLLAHQLVTAKLNCGAFGGCPSSINAMITAADSAYASGNIANMQSLMAQLDSFNNSGDTIIISPSLPLQGKATPKISESIANKSFWDNP